VRVGEVEHVVAADGEASGMAARARHVHIPGRAARLVEIDADHPARPATDAQAVAAIGGDVYGAIINREPLRVVAGIEFRQPDAPHGLHCGNRRSRTLPAIGLGRCVSRPHPPGATSPVRSTIAAALGTALTVFGP
jgi:hypothetical protein